MNADKGLHIIVIGAGSTGLLLAQGLNQHGIHCSVYEQEDATTYQTRPREWGMTLHWGAKFINECIPPDLRPGLNAGICCDPFYGEKDLTLPHYNGKTGEKLFDMPGEEPRRISRKKLRNYLSQGIDIKYGKELSSVEPAASGATATFTDGSTAHGSLIVGCDGANSIVRHCFLGSEQAEVVDLDIQMLNVSCSFPQETALLQRMGHPVFKNSYHPDGYMWWQSVQDVRDPEKPDEWLFQNCLSWIGAPRAEDFKESGEVLAYWREKAKTFAEPWRSVGRDFPDDLRIVVDRTTYWKPTIDWSATKLAGIVTIAGDAAHPMPPHRGQGLNNALQDAAVLVNEIVAAHKGEKSLLEGVQAYERDMKARTLEEIPISIMQAQMVHNFDTLMEAPFFKHGMNKYREEMEGKGKGLESATDPM